MLKLKLNETSTFEIEINDKKYKISFRIEESDFKVKDNTVYYNGVDESVEPISVDTSEIKEEDLPFETPYDFLDNNMATNDNDEYFDLPYREYADHKNEYEPDRNCNLPGYSKSGYNAVTKMIRVKRK